MKRLSVFNVPAKIDHHSLTRSGFQKRVSIREVLIIRRFERVIYDV